ncbi:hybrid sensor histidine kinase/response regulator transcription factor [Adhaeribacter arboris]|nr:two-component regulator propeller domain-containing protein [Adhaeribacter arboris]
MLGLLTLCWVLPGWGVAQSREFGQDQFTRVAHLQGLKVKCMLKDSSGFMWLGTETGLYRYDGYQTEFIPTTTVGIRLSSNSVLALYEDREANLWIGTDNGLNKLSTDRKTITAYLATAKAAATGKNSIQAILQASDGALWCSTHNGYLYRSADKEHFTFMQNVAAGTTGIFSPLVKHLTEDSQRFIWVADDHHGYQKLSPEGAVLHWYPLPPMQQWITSYVQKNKLLFADYHSIYTYSASANQFLPLVSADLSELLDNKLRYIYEDNKGYIWVATSEKLCRLNVRTQKIDDFTPAFKRTGGAPYAIDCLYEDAKGQLWLGTYFGVFRLENRENRFSVISPPGIANNTIFSAPAIYETSPGKILIGSYQGFFEYNALTKRFQEYKMFKQGRGWSNWYNPLVKAFVPAANGNLWVATEGNGVLSFNLKSHTFSQPAIPDDLKPEERASLFNYSFLRDTDGQLWLGGNNNLYLFNPKTKQALPFTWGKTKQPFSSLQIMALYQAKDQSIWVGTDYGLYRIVKGKSITGYFAAIAEQNPRAGLTNEFITCLYEGLDGRLWVGTKGGGINVLHPANGQIEETYTIKEGLANNIVCAILPGKAGELWISTDNGLSRLDRQQKTFRNFLVKDGLPNNTFHPGAAWAGSDRTLYFGSLDGIVAFDPEQFRPTAAVSRVILTKLVQHRGTKNKIEENALAAHLIRNIQLHYKDKFFTVYFALQAYFDDVNVPQFAYQVVGITDEWQPIGAKNYIQFTGLPAGKYTLRIKGMDSSGIWGKELRLPIEVGQAFYLTPVAYGFYALVIFTIIGIIFWSQFKRLQLQNQLKFEHLEQEKLRELEQMKSQFFTNITHEFRTPLTLIISPLEPLCTQPTLPPPELIKPQLKVIFRNAQRLLRLINQLLDLAKLEAGHMILDESRGEITLLVEQIVESFRPAAEQQGVQLQYVFTGASVEYIFDAEKLEKIIYNLLANALKFTASGGKVRVEVNLPASREETYELQLRVRDTGRGIPASQLPFIFNRFYQVTDARTAALAGSGLGLFLVKELVELMGGHVAAESQEGKGSSFTVVLPLRIAGNNVPAGPLASQSVIVPEEEAVSLPLPPSAEEAPLVLVVEDHEELRHFIAQELTAQYRVLTAPNGAEGWQLAQQELPNLVIADVAMPEMDGFTLSQLIKNNPLTTHIAVILLTARTSVEDRVKGLTTGANDYLIKPFNLQELQLRVANGLSYQQTLRQYWRQKFSLSNPAEEPASPSEDPFLRQVHQVLDRELANSGFLVDELAREMAVSTRTLHRKLAAITAMNANELMRYYRLSQAAVLLREGHPVAETAYRVGFEGLSYFAKCFKAQFSVSPSEYALSQPR